MDKQKFFLNVISFFLLTHILSVSALHAATVTTHKQVYEVMEPITIKFTGLACRAEEWITVVRAGKPDYLDKNLYIYKRISGSNGEVAWRGLNAGNYEARVYCGSLEPDQEVVVVARYSFRVDYPGDDDVPIIWQDILREPIKKKVINDLTGFWRIVNGPLKGWLTRVQSHENNKISLHTAPGVVLSGTWLDNSGVESINLTVSSDTQPNTTDSADRLMPPHIIRGFENVSIDADRESRIIRGQIGGPGGDWITLRKENWEIFIEKRKSTIRFTPGTNEPRRGTYEGSIGGPTAIVRFDRRPEDIIGNQEKYMAAAAYLLDSMGNSFETIQIGRTVNDVFSEGSLTINLYNRVVDGEVVWTGIKPDGTPYPPGQYTIEIVVFEGMAKGSIKHKVNLGSNFMITKCPERFAPGHEDVEIEYEWFPGETAPDEVTLIVRSKSADEDVEPIFSDKVYPMRISDSKWKVAWYKDGPLGNGNKNWTKFPFLIALKGEARDGNWRSTAAYETTVEILGMDVVVEAPQSPQGEEADWYQFDDELKEIPADSEFLNAYAQVRVLDSNEQERKIKGFTDINWEYVVETQIPDDTPRQPGFYVPGEDIRETVDVGIQYEPSEDVEGKSNVRFQPPARARQQNFLTGEIVDGDKFKLIASLKDIPDIRGESEEYTIAVGIPREIRQLFPDEIRDRFHTPGDNDFISDNFEFQYIDDAEEYKDTIAAYAIRWGARALDSASGLNDLGDALAGWKKEERKHPTRFIGIVENVPIRGFWGTKLKPFPVFLAGYAGEEHFKLKGGQAFLVIFEVLDQFGNKVPVTGDKARKVVTDVHDGGGMVPPFIVTSDTGDNQFRYKAEVNYSPFGPSTYAAPLGIHAFYYVAGVSDFSTELNSQLNELSFQLKEFGGKLEIPPGIGNTEPIDTRVDIYVEINGNEYARKSGIHLIRPESYSPPPSELVKWIKWLVFAEVQDKDTFLAELKFGMIPFAGDIRELLIYHLKDLLDREQGTLDEISYYLSVIGLLGDFGYLDPPAGLSINAFVVSTRGLVKWIRPGSKMAKGFVEFLDPLIKAIKAAIVDPRNVRKLRTLVAEMRKVSNFIGLAEDSVQKGGVDLLRERMEKIARFLNNDICNPNTCLTSVNRFTTDKIGDIFDKIPEVMDEIHELGLRLNDADYIHTAAYLLELRTHLNLSQHNVERLAQLVKKLKDPPKALSGLIRINGEVLARAMRIFNDPAFEAAVKNDERVLTTLIDVLAKHGEKGRGFFVTFCSRGHKYEDVAKLARHVMGNSDDAVDRMDDLIKILEKFRSAEDDFIFIINSDRFGNTLRKSGIGGTGGLKETIRVIAEFVNTPGGEVAAEETLKIAGELSKQHVPGNKYYIQLDDIGRAFDNLGKEGYKIYIESINFFRRIKNGVLPDGIINRSSTHASPNFLHVRSPTNAVANAFEVVATRWLIETRTVIEVIEGTPFRGRLRLTPNNPDAIGIFPRAIRKEDFDNFGWKTLIEWVAPKGKSKWGTLEGDFEATILELGGQVIFDWKKYQESGRLRKDNVDKAVKFLMNVINKPGEDIVHNVIFLSPRKWSPGSKKRIEKAYRDNPRLKGLMLGYTGNDDFLKRFLDITGG